MGTKKRVLILGSSGLIGTKLIELMKNKYDLFPTFFKTNIENGLKFDITSAENLNKIFSISTPNVVINLCAIYKNLDYCEENKELVMKTNGLPLKHISKLSNENFSHLFHISSDYVFDGEKGDYVETDLTNSINYFGKTKIEGEKNIKENTDKFCIIRTSMVYGNSSTKETLPDWILNHLDSEEKLELISDQLMTPTFLDNLCNMIIELIEKQFTGIIHLAGPEKMSRYDFAKKLIQIIGKDSHNLIPISMKKFDKNNLRPKDSSLNTNLAMKILDEKPEKFELSIKKYLKNKKLL